MAADALPPPRCAGQDEARARIASSTALRRRVDGLVRWIKSALLTVLLNTRGAQPGQAVLVDRILPGKEFLDRERVAAARFF